MQPRMGRAFAALLVAVAALGISAADAGAVTFGGDPTQPVSPQANCTSGVSPFFTTVGAQSCLWFWSHVGVGSDLVPTPVTAGTGTITGVTLPAMPNPGPMQVVILGDALAATTTPSTPDFICCQVLEFSQTFTVPANQMTTVALNLPVSWSAEANLSVPGDIGTGPIAAISVLSPTASLPLAYTGAASTPNFDGDSAYYPAPTQTNMEYVTPLDPAGYRMLASFTGVATGGGAAMPTPTPTPTPTGTPTPTPTPLPTGPAAPLGGLHFGTGPLTTPNPAGPVTLGQATNPPTVSATQTLTGLLGGAASAAKHAKQKPKPTVLGTGSTTVPAGRTVPLTIKLSGAARRYLTKHHSLKATETIVARNSAGQTQTTTRTVTIRLTRKHR